MHNYFQGNRLDGINSTYVSDLLRCGAPEFEELCLLTYEKLEVIETEELPFTRARINQRPEPDDAFAIDQLFYHQRLETLETMT